MVKPVRVGNSWHVRVYHPRKQHYVAMFSDSHYSSTESAYKAAERFASSMSATGYRRGFQTNKSPRNTSGIIGIRYESGKNCIAAYYGAPQVKKRFSLKEDSLKEAFSRAYAWRHSNLGLSFTDKDVKLAWKKFRVYYGTVK